MEHPTGSVLERVEVLMKRNCVVFERETGLIGLELTVEMVQVTDLGWIYLGDVGFVFWSILEFRSKCLFRFPNNEQLEDFCVLHFQPLLEVDVGLVEVLDGLVVRVASVEEIVVLVWLLWWLQHQQKFSLCLV